MSAGNVHRRGLRGHEQPPSDAAHGVAGALPEGGDGRGGEETLGRENVGVGIVLTGETGGEQRGSDHAAGHAPLAEAGGNVQERRGRGIGADVRHAVERHAVLRGPGKRLLRCGKKPLRLRAQTVVAVAEVFAAAVPASAEEQIAPAAPQAPALLTRVEPHPGERRRAGQRKEVRALLPQPQVVEPEALEHGEVRGDNDLLRRDRAAVAADGVAADVAHGGVLIDRQLRQQRREERQRRELRLPLEAERLTHRKGQTLGLHQPRGCAEGQGIFQLARKGGAIRRGIDEGAFVREAAVDALLPHERAELPHGAEVRLQVLTCQMKAEVMHQPLAEPAVLRGDLRRRVRGHARGEAAALQQHDAQAPRVQGVGGQNAGHAAADHGGVGVQVLPQRRVGGERIAAVPKRLHRCASEAVFAIVCRRAVSYSCRNWEIVGLAKIVTKCNH